MQQLHRIRALSDTLWHEWLNLSENQLCHYYEPAPGLFLAESPNVIGRALIAGYQPVSFLIDDACLNEQVQAILSQCPDAPVWLADTAMMEQLSGYHLTRGVLCAMRRKPPQSPDAVISAAGRIAVLENVVNPTNLGAIFRSAAALGVGGVLLTSGCCDPLYRRAVRVSMGTVFQVPWAFIGEEVGDWPHPGLERLKALGFHTAAMALSDDSVPVDDPALAAREKLAVVLGTEGEGLAPRTIADCDDTVRIPMSHGVDSLNVAAASAVAFWELGKR